MVKKMLKRLAKKTLLRTPLKRHFIPAYRYMYRPEQLWFLCEALRSTADVEGNIAEIGCAFGNTTIFLNFYMDDIGLEKPYYAVDTFSGFVDDDIDVEVNDFGKGAYSDIYENEFSLNDQAWFDLAMKKSKIRRVQSIKADVNVYDLSTLAPLSFCLLDVDLYRPIKKALPELYASMSPGGLIVVDDCDADFEVWEGADRAYKEFMQTLGRAPDIRHQKLGLIRKE